MADLYRVAETLIQNGMPVVSDSGVSEEGDPWFVYLDEADQSDVLLHLARIDGEYVIAGSAIIGALRGPDLRIVVKRLLDWLGIERKRHLASVNPNIGLAAALAALFYINQDAVARDAGWASWWRPHTPSSVMDAVFSAAMALGVLTALYEPSEADQEESVGHTLPGIASDHDDTLTATNSPAIEQSASDAPARPLEAEHTYVAEVDAVRVPQMGTDVDPTVLRPVAVETADATQMSAADHGTVRFIQQPQATETVARQAPQTAQARPAEVQQNNPEPVATEGPQTDEPPPTEAKGPIEVTGEETLSLEQLTEVIDLLLTTGRFGTKQAGGDYIIYDRDIPFSDTDPFYVTEFEFEDGSKVTVLSEAAPEYEGLGWLA